MILENALTATRCLHDLPDHSRVKRVRQLFVEAVTVEGDLLVVETELIKNRGVPVLDADSVFDRREAEFVGGAIYRAAASSSAGHPN